MRHTNKQILVYGWLCAAVLSSAACSPRRIPPLTVEDLMEDRVALDGILLKCSAAASARNNSDCQNARVAAERLAVLNTDPAVDKKRQEEFERAREQLRVTQEKVRQEQEAKTKVDAYTLPLVPVDPSATTPPKGAAPPANGPQAQGDPAKGDPRTAATTSP